MSQTQNIYRMIPRLDMFTIVDQSKKSIHPPHRAVSWNCASGQIHSLCALSSEVPTAPWLSFVQFEHLLGLLFFFYLINLFQFIRRYIATAVAVKHVESVP